MRRLAAPIVRAILLSVPIMLVAPSGYGQSPVHEQIDVQVAQAVGWPYDATMAPYGGSWYVPCYPFASCLAYRQFQTQERRRERFEQLLQERPPADRKEPWGASAAARGKGHATTSIDDAQVQPGYIGSGQIRDQYRGSGDFLPHFRDGAKR
jgi:hypothetical protein